MAIRAKTIEVRFEGSSPVPEPEDDDCCVICVPGSCRCNPDFLGCGHWLSSCSLRNGPVDSIFRGTEMSTVRPK